MSLLFGMFVFGVIILVSIVSLVFWIWALVDCLLRPEESYEKMFGTVSPKLVWALIIFFGQLIGAIIYLFVAGTRKNPRQTVVAADSAGTDEGKRILQMVADGKISSEEGQRLLVALGKKEIERAKSQPTVGPMAQIGCGCGIFVVLLILLFLAFFGFVFSHMVATDKKCQKVYSGQVQKIHEQRQAQSNELIKADRELENTKK